MARKFQYAPANGRTFKVIELDGKAPFKVLLLNADGSENYRTHHKTMALAMAKCAYYNPNYPVATA